MVEAPAPKRSATLLPDYSGWPRERLLEERLGIKATRRSMAGPIVLIALGGAAAAFDAVVLFGSLLLAGVFQAPLAALISTPMMYFMLALAGVAAVAIVTGVVWMLEVVKQRRPINDQLERVDTYLEALDSPVPQSLAPAPRMTLARF